MIQLLARAARTEPCTSEEWARCRGRYSLLGAPAAKIKRGIRAQGKLSFLLPQPSSQHDGSIAANGLCGTPWRRGSGEPKANSRNWQDRALLPYNPGHRETRCLVVNQDVQYSQNATRTSPRHKDPQQPEVGGLGECQTTHNLGPVTDLVPPPPSAAAASSQLSLQINTMGRSHQQRHTGIWK